MAIHKWDFHPLPGVARVQRNQLAQVRQIVCHILVD